MNCVDSLIDMMGGGQLLENSEYKGMDEMMIISKVLRSSNCTSGKEGDNVGEDYGYFSSSCSSPNLDTTSSSVSGHEAMHLQAYSYINCEEEDYFPNNPAYINHSYSTKTEFVGSNPASDFNDPTQYLFTCMTPHKEHMYHKSVCGKAHDLGSNPAFEIYDPTQYFLTCENPHKDQYMYYKNVCGKAHDSQLVTELPTSSRSSASSSSSSSSIADPFHYILADSTSPDSAHEYKGDQRAAEAVCTQIAAAAQHTEGANALHTARVKDYGCVRGSTNENLSDYDQTCKGTSGCNASCRFNCTSINAANCCSSIEITTHEAQISSSKLRSGLKGGDLLKTEEGNAGQNPAALYGLNIYGCADDQYTAAAVGTLHQHAGGAGAAAKGLKAGGDYLHDVIAAAAMDHQSTAAENDLPDTNMPTRAAKGDVDDSTHIMDSGTCEASSGSNIPNWREAVYTQAALQAVDWQDIVTSAAVGRPKRRNIRLSAHPQTTSARNRRERISLRIRVLQRLVPGGTHMDTASMLDEAVHYLKFLKAQLQALKCLEKSSLTSSLPFATVPTNGFSTFPKDQWSC